MKLTVWQATRRMKRKSSVQKKGRQKNIQLPNQQKSFEKSLQRCHVTLSRLQGGIPTVDRDQQINALHAEDVVTGDMSAPTSTTSAIVEKAITNVTSETGITKKTDTTNTDKSFYFTSKQSETNTSLQEQQQFVKGKLKEKLHFWKNELKAPSNIIDTIEFGYKLPFINTPKRKFSENNKAAFENEKFVTESIEDLLQDNSVIEVDHIPHVVSPLSVSTDRAGKKRLILDLRYVNKHLYKERISFDDWRVFENYISENSFGYKFDLKKGYHHVEIFEEHQTFLGFSWGTGASRRYFIFTVLPFGLSSAPMLFTKMLRPLVSYWHERGINICVFLDDGAGTEKYQAKTSRHSKFVKNTLDRAGWVSNLKKSIWDPTTLMIWLGVQVDFQENVFRITDKRIRYLLEDIDKAINTRFTSARKLSKLVGSIISTKFVLGDITGLKTRFLYNTIESSPSWDSIVDISDYHNSFEEILFWKNNLVRLNKRKFMEYRGHTLQVASDASSTGIGVIIPALNLKAHKQLSESEKVLSSTWRELQAIVYGIKSFKEVLKNLHVSWSTDNYAATIIVLKGSNKMHLQSLAVNIYELCTKLNIRLKVNWVPREMNTEADRLSKYVDIDDWQITNPFFKDLDEKWGPHTIDRFASFENSKLHRFNSKFYSPNTEGVDAFSCSWENENNLFVPPVKLIPRVLKKIFNVPTVGTLVIPLWKSQCFWSMLKSTRYNWMVKDHLIIENGRKILENSDIPFQILTSEKYNGSMIAVRVDSRF